MKSGKCIGQMLYPRRMELANIPPEWHRNPGKGTWGSLKISWGSMLPDPAGRFGACLGNRSVFVLDPRLEVAVNLLHF